MCHDSNVGTVQEGGICMTRIRRTVISMLLPHSKHEFSSELIWTVKQSSLRRFFTLFLCLLALMTFCSNTLLCHASENGAAGAPADERSVKRTNDIGQETEHGLSADKTLLDFGTPDQIGRAHV